MKSQPVKLSQFLKIPLQPGHGRFYRGGNDKYAALFLQSLQIFTFTVITGISLLQLLLDGAYAWGWQSMLGDYIVAFSVLGLAGLFHKQEKGFFTGTVVGSLARFLVHYLVGVWVWGEYMPDTFFGMTMTTPWFYSFLYNGSYMLVDMILCLVIGALLWKPMGKYLRGEDIKRA